MGNEARCLGLIGGLGPGATIHYYRELIAAHQAQGRIPRLLIAHADVNRALALAGAEGVTHCVNLLRADIEMALALTGRASIGKVDRTLLW